MTSFGKLSAAFQQVSAEATLAFASFNFDFALIKYEAPEEYKGLGDSLSQRRKDAAEDGSSHITARKLNALFRTIIPEVPHLTQAYGQRATEIAKSPHINPRDTSTASVFADHIGADSTTIWAAATSGNGAVTIHLLACMLARIWTRKHAVSIWTELIEQRKEVLRGKLEGNGDPFHISDIAASRIEITTSQLDDWDASARSWLQTADEAKILPQTQLRLIIDNVTLPVSTQDNVYTAVTEAWTSAMLALEHLITGTPQRIQDGAVLLGLSAWHLYPDMSVLGDRCQHIKQADPLISPGGIITLGLQGKTEELDKGIFWSLPLARVYYYGDPIVTTGQAGIGESRVTFNEFMFVVLGSVLAGWNLSDITPQAALILIQLLTKAIDFEKKSKAVQQTQWLKLLASVAVQVGRPGDVPSEQITRLISFGQRRCSDFLGPIYHCPPPVFGLTDFKVLLETFGDNIDLKLEMLKLCALKLLHTYNFRNLVLRYKTNIWAYFTYISISSVQNRGKKRTWDSEDPAAIILRFEWLHEEEINSDCPIDLSNPPNQETHFPTGLEERTCSIYMPPGPGKKPVNHTFVCGDAQSAAIFVSTEHETKLKNFKNEISVKDLLSLIDSHTITQSQLASRLVHSGHLSKFSIYFQSLQAVHEAEQIYSYLRGARVDLQVTSHTLSLSKWWNNFSYSIGESDTRDLCNIFSCIALFETGVIDVDPATIGEGIIAMCNANSIFVASELLLDPTAEVPPVPVERMTGNIGKPGLAFLITPPNPKIGQVDSKSWNVIDHKAFDGSHTDSFTSTSLHLSFTGFELPLDLGQRGIREVPALFIETAVSVYDRGQWIADLDIMKSCKSWAGLKPTRPCSHPRYEKTDANLFTPLVCIDSWKEFLDPPLQNSIVRARSNATARLATASLALQQYRKVLIMPKDECWHCLSLTIDEIADRSQEQTIKVGNESKTVEVIDISEDSEGPEDSEDSGDTKDFSGSKGTNHFDSISPNDLTSQFAFHFSSNLPKPLESARLIIIC